MKLKRPLKLLIAVVVSELAGVIGSLFTIPSIPAWYDSLIKPALNPPSWIFGPVWLMLYFLMGISAFLIWQSDLKKGKIRALAVFGGQLVLNIIWSVIFFGLHNLFWAFIEIIILWLAIVWTILVFYKTNKPAAYLLLPYIIWVSFAAYLNYSILIINKF